MKMSEVMKQKSFVIAGDTLNEEKFAYKIKEAMLNKGYQVQAVGKELKSINDADGEIDVIDLCINPVKGLQLLKENEKSFKSVVIQPGAGSDELEAYLEEKGIPYINDCLLQGLAKYRADA